MNIFISLYLFIINLKILTMNKKSLPRKENSVLALLGTFMLSMTAYPAHAQLLDPITQGKFANPLPVPAQIDATNGVSLQMEMNQTSQWLGLTDPATGQTDTTPHPRFPLRHRPGRRCHPAESRR